jgi:hypothetical protein
VNLFEFPILSGKLENQRGACAHSSG